MNPHATLDALRTPLDPHTLSGKTVLVTGANGALGSALSRACASAGATVILLGRNISKLETLYDELEAQGAPQPGIYPLDLEGASVKDYQDLQQNLQREFGQLHALAHCAVSLGRPTPMASYPADVWIKTFNINVHGPMLLTQACLPLLQHEQKGAIVFPVDRRQNAFSGAYSASKAAQASYFKVLAAETNTELTSDNQPKLAVYGAQMSKLRSKLRAAAYPGEDPNTNPAPELFAPALTKLMARQGDELLSSGDTLDLSPLAQ